MQINDKLIWDYDARTLDLSDESVERWYVERVLTRGGMNDLRAVGLARIRKHLPNLALPPRVRDFWQWYLAQEGQRGNPHTAPTEGSTRDRRKPAA